MEESKSRISQDIIRSFRKNLNQEVIFMCLYQGETDGGIVTNERPFKGQELIDLFSSVIRATEDYMVPAIMYALFTLYGPIRVFDMVKAYAKAYDMKGPFTIDPGSTPGAPPVGEG